MSCPQCPHCQLGVEKRGQTLSLTSNEQRNNEEKKETPKLPVRGKAREYTQAFDIVWKAYPRREQKLEAFGVWLIRAKEVGGEPKLVTLILGSLRWQVPVWARTWEREGKNVAPYLERYLKRRKWEDEPMPVFQRQAVPMPVDDRTSRAVDDKIAAYRDIQARALTPEERAEISKLRKAGGNG